MGRFFARPVAKPASFPPVTVAKPLHGAERALLPNLSSFWAHNYAGPVQFLLGVHDVADPALRVVDELRRLHPEAGITIADASLYGIPGLGMRSARHIEAFLLLQETIEFEVAKRNRKRFAAKSLSYGRLAISLLLSSAALKPRIGCPQPGAEGASGAVMRRGRFRTTRPLGTDFES